MTKEIGRITEEVIGLEIIVTPLGLSPANELPVSKAFADKGNAFIKVMKEETNTPKSSTKFLAEEFASIFSLDISFSPEESQDKNVQVVN